MIDTLIDKQDSSEVIRDKIAAILAAETVSQQALAVAQVLPPEDWKFRVFIERSNPWELFTGDPVDSSPVINVWFDNATFDGQASNTVARQKADGVFNVDCYGYGISEDVISGGHEPGDKVAAFEAQRALRLVRNILMAANYVRLDKQGLVWSRFPQSVNIFQPEINATQVENVVGARLALRVGYNEFAPEITPEVLELLTVDVKRAEDGQIIVEADF